MARARLLHPEFSRHEQLGTLSHSHRLLFALLPTIADREGRIEDRPRRIQADLFPYDPPDSMDMEGMLADLAGFGFIERYEAQGKNVVLIPSFKRWQKCHPRERASELPPKAREGSPKANPRPTKGETRRPVSDPVSVSVSVSDPVTDPETLPDAASGAGEKGKTIPVWDAFRVAYVERWGVEPLRNRTVNGQLSRFIDAVGAQDSPAVAAFYVRHNQPLYVNAKHPVNLLLRDAQKLHTEWVNNAPMTDSEARQIGKTQANAAGWSALLKGAN